MGVTDSILRYREIGHVVNALSCDTSFAVSSLRVCMYSRSACVLRLLNLKSSETPYSVAFPYIGHFSYVTCYDIFYTSLARAMKVLRKLGCRLQIKVGIVQSLCRQGSYKVYRELTHGSKYTPVLHRV